MWYFFIVRNILSLYKELFGGKWRHVSDARGLDDADFYSRPMNLSNKPEF